MFSKLLTTIVLSLNILMGIFVFIQSPKKVNNITFLVMCVIASLWSIANFFTEQYLSLHWLNVTYSLGALLISCGLIWTLLITGNYKRKYGFLVITLGILFACLSLSKNFLFSNYIVNNFSFTFGNVNFGLLLYSVFYIFYSFFIIKILHSCKSKKEIKNVYFGALITLVFTAVSSLILPLESHYIFVDIDNLGFLIFIIFIFYSIYYFKFFDIKTFSAQLIIFSLWIVLFSRIVFSYDIHEFYINIFIFLMSLLIGLIIIRILKITTQQRHEIRELTNRMRDIYDKQL